MSYITFQQKCEDCSKTWNAAFGIVGKTRIAEPASCCPFCKSEKIVPINVGWSKANGACSGNPT